ncbi:ribosome biogenesis regulatory protein-like protein [Platysternon megacephalum]|uniref:Ribosome biogenesis regulatory protein-like protein n=1 Tax=Platysternon megacephalum TaxID=55544 RepID=A0A4D9F195_9SAUR|nr:ribosome biogenesis regulatory protein-like protein [Platysternon megacephalum]
MAVVETRPELVGKRFLCVGGGEEEPPERGESGRWRSGVIRAVSHRDSHSPELAVYVEFDDLEWEKREWVKVYEDFAAFLVEYQLVWAKRKDPSQTQGSKIKHIQWPALSGDESEKEGLIDKGERDHAEAIVIGHAAATSTEYSDSKRQTQDGTDHSDQDDT